MTSSFVARVEHDIVQGVKVTNTWLSQAAPRLIVTQKCILFILLINHSFFANAQKENIPLPTPPVEFVLDVQNVGAGTGIEADFQIVEKKLYAFEIQFLSKKGDEVDRSRIRKLSGGVGGRDTAGKMFIPLNEKGASFLLKLSVYKRDGNQKNLLLQEIIKTDEIGLSSSGPENFNKEIAALFLVPSQYHVVVEPIFVAPELAKTSIHLLINFAYRGK